MISTKAKWSRRLHKRPRRRLDWKHREMEEAPAMVKGTNRRVVVVKSPDGRIFEEAIFIVREDMFHHGNSAEKVMREARQAAGAYLRGATGLKKPPLWRRIPAGLFAALSAAAAGVVWLACRLVGV